MSRRLAVREKIAGRVTGCESLDTRQNPAHGKSKDVYNEGNPGRRGDRTGIFLKQTAEQPA
jgi:hypothetical protein